MLVITPTGLYKTIKDEAISKVEYDKKTIRGKLTDHSATTTTDRLTVKSRARIVKIVTPTSPSEPLGDTYCRKCGSNPILEKHQRRVVITPKKDYVSNP